MKRLTLILGTVVAIVAVSAFTTGCGGGNKVAETVVETQAELNFTGMNDDELVDAILVAKENGYSDEVIEEAVLAEIEQQANDEVSFDNFEVADPTENSSLGETNALKAAENYLDLMAFSKSGLADQLEYDGYTEKQIEFAVNNCYVDFAAEAAEAAENYIEIMAFSKQELTDQLEYDGYTENQIRFALQMVGY
jgi:SOS response regulatory protein OraA/RecX